MDAGRCSGLFEDAGADRRVLPARRNECADVSAGARTVSGMRTVVVDKIASVTQACGLSHEIRIATDIPSKEGVGGVVEILNNKPSTTTLNLTRGRMPRGDRGEVVARAAGNRKRR